jgi:hypothetical protein
MKLRWLCLILALAWFSGCDQYRYPCQNPDNWEKKECKRPYCSSTGTCPDQLVKPEDAKVESNEPAKADTTVPCVVTGTARCSN